MFMQNPIIAPIIISLQTIHQRPSMLFGIMFSGVIAAIIGYVRNAMSAINPALTGVGIGKVEKRGAVINIPLSLDTTRMNIIIFTGVMYGSMSTNIYIVAIFSNICRTLSVNTCSIQGKVTIKTTIPAIIFGTKVIVDS